MKLNKNVFLILGLFFALSFPLAGSCSDNPYGDKVLVEKQDKQVMKGQVQEVLLDSDIKLPDGEKQRQQLVKVKLLDGKIIEAVNSIPPHLSYQVILKKGDKIVLSQEDGAVYIEGYYREDVCWILLGLFALLMVIIGGKKGVLAFLSLIIKGSLLLFVLIPALKLGVSPIIAASIFCGIATFLTITLVSGWNRKTVAACFGTIGGVIVAGFIGAWAVQASHLSGLLEPEMESLHYQFPLIKITEMIAAGVLIGSLGASMDVAISIASALYEVYLAAPHKKLFELYKIGMNIGQDVMGTMVNTLILAYAGSALATIILVAQINPAYFLSMELVVKEIILAIVGSIGLILTIPITALLSSYLFKGIEPKSAEV
jgi:uncharacterized membrane protein